MVLQINQENQLLTALRLGKTEMKLAKEYYKWTYEEDFYVPSEVYELFEENVLKKVIEKEAEWEALFARYKKANPELAKQLELAIEGELPEGWDKDIPVYEEGNSLATRDSGVKY